MAARLAFALIAAGLPTLACAGPSASARDYPAGVGVGKTADGPVYVDGRQKTLYTMSIRWARARSGVGIEYCAAACLAAFTPLPAEADAKPVGEWSVIKGPRGPQWVYKKNPVFSFNADSKPGDNGGDHYDLLWSTLYYEPPTPIFQAPAAVTVTAVDGVNIFTDLGGRALFTAPGKASANQNVFAAAMASKPVGDWTVLRDRDVPQWAWRGHPVFVSQADKATDTPAGATPIKP